MKTHVEVHRVLFNELEEKIKPLIDLSIELTKLSPIKDYSGTIGRSGVFSPFTDEDLRLNGIIGDVEYSIHFMSQAIENLKKCTITKKI
jgi:hypothetical protein